MIRFRRSLFLIVAAFLLMTPAGVWALTAGEILDQVARKGIGEGGFRIALQVETTKGKKKLKDHTIWLMGRVKADETSLFVDIEAPADSRGTRFLFKARSGQKPEAHLYLPSTGKTSQLDRSDPTAELGGTGLTMEEILALVPQGDETATLAKEELAEGLPSYVIRIASPGQPGERLIWVAKDDFFVLKSHQLDADGKVRKSFRVVEFFKTEQGRTFPRAEEILIPDKGLRIKVRQESAVFGIEIPEEVLDPKAFGAFQWRV
ncbi:MAG: outer membrane lipoprotein-sorting protein [Deltaproteobacteria bacterium]|nr:outer membrane lipoprotein-sorting protein [Deltaproteobacteria bacterium]